MTVTDQDPAPLAVITGGAGDVGVATAEHMIRDGWRVVLADRDLTGARTRVAELGEQASAIHLDLAEDHSITEVARSLVSEKPSALVSCAGVAVVEPFIDGEPATWDLLHQVNLRGPMLLTRALLPALKQAANPRIVYVASDSARAGAANEAAYAASKSGLFGLAKSLAREHARDAVTVNLVCPGPIEGAMVSEAMAGKESMLAKLKAAIPMRRLAAAEDVASAIAWLCSPGAGYVTGQTLSVSGGITMQ